MRRIRSEVGEPSCENEQAKVDMELNLPDAWSIAHSMMDHVTVTIGREVYQPIQFHTLEVGPVSMTTTIRQGETVQDAMDRATKHCEERMSKLFEAKLEDFRRRRERVRGDR